MDEKHRTIADIIDNVRRIFQILNEQSKKIERETGLTGPQLWTIKAIAESSPVRVLDLAKRIYLHPATVVGILDRLEARGYLLRRRSGDDRRVVWVELTEKGNGLLSSAPEVAQGLLASGLETLGGEKLRDINLSLVQLVAIFGAQKVPPQLIRSSEWNVPAGDHPSPEREKREP
ncbi:MAG: MarR family transcriptional regulator [Deltaproteobacteria bacterium HGW-Deltaproteobacteria-19]|nr:MAG: MarR family transcriptional regulator [Deltaproteobacteria bacterium HGW-Deltaproteobacteria-19]